MNKSQHWTKTIFSVDGGLIHSLDNPIDPHAEILLPLAVLVKFLKSS